MMVMQERIENKLNGVFAPNHLVVANESAKHSGHAGDDGSGESHFRIDIVSDKFAGLSPVAVHRAIYECLDEEMKTIHALSIFASQHKR